MLWSVRYFCWRILVSTFTSFIVSCRSLIWLFSDIASSEALSRYTSIFRYSWQVSWYILVLYLNCSGYAGFDFTEASGSSTQVIYKNILTFRFAFSQFSTMFSSSFFPEIGGFSGNSWSVGVQPINGGFINE